MIETFSPDSPFITRDSRQYRWAVPYHHECLNARVENLIAKNRNNISGKDILDLGCHFGTFSYAALQHGAKSVTGIDSESQLTAEALELFRLHNAAPSAYAFYAGDVVDYLETCTADSYDTILCLGIFYYIQDPVRLLRLMKKVTRRSVILDTFTAYYSAVVSKDGVEIAQHTTAETFGLPVVFHPIVQAEKQDYTLPHSYANQKNKRLSLLTLPTLRAFQNFFDLVGLSSRELSWDNYIVNNHTWQDFTQPHIKKQSHWADVYHTKIRVSYVLEKTGGE